MNKKHQRKIELNDNGRVSKYLVIILIILLIIIGIIVSFKFKILKPKEKTLVQAFKNGEIQVGDYITNYNENLLSKSASQNVSIEESGIDKEQVYTVDANTTWRVLGLDESGEHLKLITGDPIRKNGDDPYLHLKGAEGWYYTNNDFVGKEGNLLNKICKIYNSNLAMETRSITPEDINLALGVKVDKNASKLYRINDSEKKPINSFSGDYGIENEYTFKVGNYSPFNYLIDKDSNIYEKEMNLKKHKNEDKIKGNGYTYIFDQVISKEKNEKLYKMLFDEVGGFESKNMDKAYYLASTGNFSRINGDVRFGPGVVRGSFIYSASELFNSNGKINEYILGVRPVVVLNSEVSVKDLNVVREGKENEWKGTNKECFISSQLTNEIGKIK